MTARARARVRAAIIATVLGLAWAPEAVRWAAERRLYRASALLETALRGPANEPRRAATLAAAAGEAERAAASLRGDSRAWIVAGSARLVGGDATGARRAYRHALATGERAEIDLNLARAWSLLGRQDRAQPWLLRALWIQPALGDSIPQGARAAYSAAIESAAKRLAAGALDAPPFPRPSETDE